MPSFRRAVVTAVLDERPGFQRIDLDDGSRAYALTQIVGAVAAGDAVVVNTTAVDLGLGTGGHHVVHLNLERVDRSVPGPGHIMKARYLSEQLDTGSWEDSTAHSASRNNRHWRKRRSWEGWDMPCSTPDTAAVARPDKSPELLSHWAGNTYSLFWRRSWTHRTA